MVNGAAIDTVAQGAAAVGGKTGTNILRGIDVAQHLAKLSGSVLMPQMAKEDEDAADALGFDLMVKAGYDPEAPLAVMDKLAAQEAEAAAAAAAARQAEQQDKGAGGQRALGRARRRPRYRGPGLRWDRSPAPISSPISRSSPSTAP